MPYVFNPLSGNLEWTESDAVHNLGGERHSADTLVNLNSKVSDATLIDTLDSRLSDDRDPTAHALEHTDGIDDIQSATNLQKGVATAAHVTAIEANTAHVSLVTGNPHVVTKAEVGLSAVPNIDTTNASNISSGTLPSSVLPPVALTDVQVAISEVAQLALTTEEGDVVVRSDENKSYMHNGGIAGTMADFTELQTPTDSVLSVNGDTGTVVLNQDDIADGVAHVQTANDLTDILKSKLDAIEAGADVNNISDTDATDLTDGGDTTLHDHDGISENTNARHTQNTDTALGAQTEDLDMNNHQIVSLSVPDAAGKAIRQTTKITETALEDAVDKKHARSHSIVSTSDHSDVANFIDGPLSPGVLTGGFISEGTVGTVTVSAITALLRTGTETTDPLVYVSLAEQANIAIGSADTKYHIGLDYNSGTLQVLVQIASFNRTTEIGLGTCMKDTSTPVRVHFANAGMRLQDGVAKLQQRATSLRRTELASGCAIADVGGATRQFNIQKGIVYHGIYRMTPFDAAPYNPYISGDDGYFLVYGDTATGFTISDGTDTVINNTQYWNTTTHALDNVKNKQFACHWVYIHTDDEHVYVVLGNDSYKLAEAVLAQPLGDLPIEISDFGLLLGCIIIERNATAFELVQMVTDTFFTGSAVGIHNSLGGLNDGDYKHLLEVEYTEISEWLDNVVLGSDGLTSVPEMVLVPRAAALSDVVGGFYFSDIDTSVYVCTSAT